MLALIRESNGRGPKLSRSTPVATPSASACADPTPRLPPPLVAVTQLPNKVRCDEHGRMKVLAWDLDSVQQMHAWCRERLDCVVDGRGSQPVGAGRVFLAPRWNMLLLKKRWSQSFPMRMAGRWRTGARGKRPRSLTGTKNQSARRKVKSQPRDPVLFAYTRKIGRFSKSKCRYPLGSRVFLYPGRDSKGFKPGKSGASLGCSFMSPGLCSHGGSGASFVDPSPTEQRGLLGPLFWGGFQGETPSAVFALFRWWPTRSRRWY